MPAYAANKSGGGEPVGVGSWASGGPVLLTDKSICVEEERPR